MQDIWIVCVECKYLVLSDLDLCCWTFDNFHYTDSIALCSSQILKAKSNGWFPSWSSRWRDWNISLIRWRGKSTSLNMSRMTFTAGLIQSKSSGKSFNVAEKQPLCFLYLAPSLPINHLWSWWWRVVFSVFRTGESWWNTLLCWWRNVSLPSPILSWGPLTPCPIYEALDIILPIMAGNQLANINPCLPCSWKPVVVLCAALHHPVTLLSEQHSDVRLWYTISEIMVDYVLSKWMEGHRRCRVGVGSMVCKQKPISIMWKDMY